MTPSDLVELKDFPDYGATPDGRIWSRKSGTWRTLALTSNGFGYIKVKVIDIDGHTHTRKVHVLIAAAFLGERPDDLDINHKDGVKANNAVTNLEYLTRRENVLHSMHVLGNKHGAAPPPASAEEVARRHRVDRCMRRRALAYRLWSRDGRRGLSSTAAIAMRLNEQQVLEIRGHAMSRTMTRRAMAKHYSVSRPTIDRIIARQKWAHV